MASRPSEPENLPCPRCDSTNTKFCYYNNYNLSQPRHFCKSCRRYWTRGGTLRNVPVGGGSRKSSSSTSSASSSTKRVRTTPATPTPTTAAAVASSPSSDNNSSNIAHEPLHGNPVSMVPQMGSGSGPMTGSLMGCEMNLNEAVPEASNISSFLTTQGLLPFGGEFGLGLGTGLHGLGFGLGPMEWSMETVGAGNDSGDVIGGGGDGGGGGGGNNNGSGGGSSTGCNNTWQMGSGEGGLAEGDCFGWPDLAISMPGKGLK